MLYLERRGTGAARSATPAEEAGEPVERGLHADTDHHALPSRSFDVPPEDVLFLRNGNGVLAGSPLSVRGCTRQPRTASVLWLARPTCGRADARVRNHPRGRLRCGVARGARNGHWLRQEWTSISSVPTRFGTFIGVAPTIDAKIVDTFSVASAVHSGVLCLVDGDSAGLGYLSDLKALSAPPSTVFVWPEDWAMEHVVAWVADADSMCSMPALQTALGAPFGDTAAFVTFLLAHKSYVPVHNATSEALAGIPPCRARVAELLNDLADVARQAEGQEEASRAMG